jgi:asparagine synthase (glutamine-hydrolysing)
MSMAGECDRMPVGHKSSVDKRCATDMDHSGSQCACNDECVCGIVGWVGRAPDNDLLRRMTASLVHRGPDDEGYFVTDDVALGIRRLAIIDVDQGRQPIFNEDGSIATIFNGEIYNFTDLRQRLTASGHRFKTNSDTETIVHLYEEFGERCVEHLRGMFAFAIWDAPARKLVLARDRLGKKPLLYRLAGQELTFASELKALMADRSLVRNIDPQAVHHYLTYQYVPAPWSIIDGVKKLPPGHVLVYQDGNARLTRYWRLEFQPKRHYEDQDAIEETRRLVREATGIRLASERPLGVFLSGGVDSAIVVAAASEQAQAIQTFSVGFDNPRYDERRLAEATSKHFGTAHHELIIGREIIDRVPTICSHFDEPFADPSAIPTFELARWAREHVVVALTGDGGDEAFGGYDRYRVVNALAHHRLFSWSLSRAARVLNRGIPRGDRHSRAGRLWRLVTYLQGDPESGYLNNLSAFTDSEKKSGLYTQEFANSGLDARSEDLTAKLLHESNEAALDPVDTAICADVQTYLPGDLLVKLDTATMANSLEARSPFLDHVVMEFAARLRPNLKVRDKTGKYLLKQAGNGWIPDEILRARKKGFGVPIAEWLRGPLQGLMRDALADSVARQRGYFRPEAVDALIDKHQNGWDLSNQLWPLVQFELWCRAVVDRG